MEILTTPTHTTNVRMKTDNVLSTVSAQNRYSNAANPMISFQSTSHIVAAN